MMFAHLLSKALHAGADLRQAYLQGGEPASDKGKAKTGGCTPCAAAAYVEKARQTNAKKYGVG